MSSEAISHEIASELIFLCRPSRMTGILLASAVLWFFKIEDTINDVLGELASAVTAVPCDVKGERLVVFYTRRDVSPADLWDRLIASPLPRLWIPKRDDLVPIDAIPTLGTGKIDLQALKTLARTRGTC